MTLDPPPSGTRKARTIALDANVHLRLGRVRNRVSAELDVGAMKIVSIYVYIYLCTCERSFQRGKQQRENSHDDVPKHVPQRVVLAVELETRSCVRRAWELGHMSAMFSPDALSSSARAETQRARAPRGVHLLHDLRRAAARLSDLFTSDPPCACGKEN